MIGILYLFKIFICNPLSLMISIYAIISIEPITILILKFILFRYIGVISLKTVEIYKKTVEIQH